MLRGTRIDTLRHVRGKHACFLQQGDIGAHVHEFAATADGKWLSYVYVNPTSGGFWVISHDGLVFGSGWHHDEYRRR